MEFSELLESRRSIRSYAECEQIEREVLEQIVYAAQQAPSWKNGQEGRYYIVYTKEDRERLRSTCLPGFNAERTQNACAFIVTTFEKGGAGFDSEGRAVDDLGDGWGCFDLGLQCENLILKARELGYDTLIMGLRRVELLRVMLDIPQSRHIVAVIALGKRAADVEKPVRLPMEDVAKFF